MGDDSEWRMPNGKGPSAAVPRRYSLLTIRTFQRLADLLDRSARQRAEPFAAGRQMLGHLRPHARIPEQPDVVGRARNRIFLRLDLEEIRDLVGHPNERIRCHRNPMSRARANGWGTLF